MPGRRPAEIVVGTLVIGVLAAAISWTVFGGSGDGPAPTPSSGNSSELNAHAVADLAFPDFTFDRDALRQQWETERDALPEPSMLSGILDDHYALNRQNALVAIGVAAEGSGVDAQAWQERVLIETRLHGNDAWRAAGWQAWDRFQSALRAFLEQSARTDVPPRELVFHTADPVVAEYMSACGDFLDVATLLGIVDEDGALKAPPEILTLLFRYRWFSTTSANVPIDEVLSELERSTFHRWRIEAARAVPVQTRLTWIGEYEQTFGFDAYPAAFARAVAWADAGDEERAREALQEAVRAAPEWAANNDLIAP